MLFFTDRTLLLENSFLKNKSNADIFPTGLVELLLSDHLGGESNNNAAGLTPPPNLSPPLDFLLDVCGREREFSVFFFCAILQNVGGQKRKRLSGGSGAHKSAAGYTHLAGSWFGGGRHCRSCHSGVKPLVTHLHVRPENLESGSRKSNVLLLRSLIFL